MIAINPDDLFQHAVITGVAATAAQHGYEVVVKAQDAQRREIGHIDLNSLAGVLVIANAVSDVEIQKIYVSGLPVSLICHQLPDTRIPVVMSNNVQGIAELVSHLVTRCHRRRLVFIRGLMAQNDGWQRDAAFRQEVLRHGLKVPDEHFLNGEFSAPVAAQAIRQLITRRDHFDGIVASDYVMAMAAVEELCAAGIKVPQDVSVVGFGDGPEAELAGLTTVAASIAELGVCATRQLISQIEGLRISGVTMLNVRLIVRDTCGYQLVDPSLNP